MAVQVVVDAVQKTCRETQLLKLLPGLDPRHLAGGGRHIGPGLCQTVARQAHQVPRASDLRLLTQMHPVLPDDRKRVVSGQIASGSDELGSLSTLTNKKNN